MTLAAAGTYSSVALVVTVVATVVVLALIGALYCALRAARQLRCAADQLQEHSRAVLEELQATVRYASDELERMDDLIGSAERLTDTV